MVSMEIKQIIIHQDWKPYVTRYDADIAILVFNEEVQLSAYIKTICLPMRSQALSLKEGEVVGWGYSERTNLTRAEEMPRKTKIKAPPSNEFCFLTETLLTSLSSNRTFCAGGENTGPCHGDSVKYFMEYFQPNTSSHLCWTTGGGFYTKVDSTWYLQGIVSSSLVSIDHACDVTKYAVYTNVGLFSDWVWERVNGLNQLSLPCAFDYATNLKRYVKLEIGIFLLMQASF